MPTTVQNAQASFVFLKETVPALIPTSAEDLETQTCYMDKLFLSNVGNAASIVTISDKQGTPVVALNPTLAPGDVISLDMNERLFSGGITWIQSVANQVSGYVKWKR